MGSPTNDNGMETTLWLVGGFSYTLKMVKNLLVATKWMMY
jgi:hypothetical protein